MKRTAHEHKEMARMKGNNDKYWQGCREEGSFMCCRWERNSEATPEDSLAAPQVDKHRVTIEFSNVFPK